MKIKMISCIFFAILMTSCIQDNAENEKVVAELREKIAGMENEIVQARVKGESLKKIEDSQKELEKSIQVLQDEKEAAESQLKELKETFEAEKEAAEKLQKEFAEYKRRYTAQVREKVIGSKMAQFKTASGKVYRNVQIVEVQDEIIRLKHAGGFASLGLNDLSRDWVSKYQMGVKVQPEPVVVAVTLSPVMEEKGEIAKEPKVAEEGAMQQSLSVSINLAQKAVVIIEGDRSVGTGFFVKDGVKTYLYTAAHVLSGNKRLEMKTNDGRVYKKFGRVEVAEKVDLLRMEVMENVEAALAMIKPNGILIDAHILALGNSGGGAVLSASDGKVLGVGSESFEISNEIIQGNSGGPILSADGKTVLGLVTHAIAKRDDVWAKNTRFNKVRRFAARLDKPFNFQPTTLSAFLNEAETIQRMDRVTRLIFALSMLKPTRSGLKLTRQINASYTALQIFEENKGMRAVKDLLALNGEYGRSRIRFSEIELKKQYAKYYENILKASQRQLSSFGGSGMSAYHNDMAKESLKWRRIANQALGSQINGLTR